MKILVANLGSTSFKYRLFDMTDESQLARGGIDRIGQSASACFVEIGGRREAYTFNFVLQPLYTPEQWRDVSRSRQRPD